MKLSPIIGLLYIMGKINPAEALKLTNILPAMPIPDRWDEFVAMIEEILQRKFI